LGRRDHRDCPGERRDVAPPDAGEERRPCLQPDREDRRHGDGGNRCDGVCRRPVRKSNERADDHAKSQYPGGDRDSPDRDDHRLGHNDRPPRSRARQQPADSAVSELATEDPRGQERKKLDMNTVTPRLPVSSRISSRISISPDGSRPLAGSSSTRSSGSWSSARPSASRWRLPCDSERHVGPRMARGRDARSSGRQPHVRQLPSRGVIDLVPALGHTARSRRSNLHPPATTRTMLAITRTAASTGWIPLRSGTPPE
jgi:hypothetical protein